MEILDTIFNVGFSGGDLLGAVSAVYNSFTSEPSVSAVIDVVTDVYSSAGIAFLIVIALLSVVLSLLGFKLYPLIRVLICGVFGLVIGVAWVHPALLLGGGEIPGIVVGGISALVIIVLGRIAYPLIYLSLCGYSSYAVAYTGWLLPGDGDIFEGNIIPSLVIGIIAILLALALERLIVTLGTSVLGGIGFSFALSGLVDYTYLFGEWAAAVFWAVVVIIALIGLRAQLKCSTKKKK